MSSDLPLPACPPTIACTNPASDRRFAILTKPVRNRKALRIIFRWRATISQKSLGLSAAAAFFVAPMDHAVAIDKGKRRVSSSDGIIHLGNKVKSLTTRNCSATITSTAQRTSQTSKVLATGFRAAEAARSPSSLAEPSSISITAFSDQIANSRLGAKLRPLHIITLGWCAFS